MKKIAYYGMMVLLGIALPVFAEKSTIDQPAAVNADQAAAPTAADPKTDAADASSDPNAPAVTAGESTIDTSKDPSENFNRAMFQFNETVDTYIAKPVAEVYNKIIPKPLNMGIHNFFNNIDELPTIANDLLQINIYQMTNDLWRFGVNTTVGIGGLFDIATRIKLPYYSNDFGLTMAAYGYEDSSYLVLPFWGPRTWRDAMGLPVDYFAFSIYPYIYPERTRYALYAVSVLDARAQLLKYQDILEEAAIDKYVFMRDAYLQRRAAQIKENQHLGYDERQDQSFGDSSGTTSEGLQGV